MKAMVVVERREIRSCSWKVKSAKESPNARTASPYDITNSRAIDESNYEIC